MTNKVLVSITVGTQEVLDSYGDAYLDSVTNSVILEMTDTWGGASLVCVHGGYMHDDGTFIEEPSHRFEVMVDGTESNLQALRDWAAVVADLYEQVCVLYTEQVLQVGVLINRK
ncbi:hypothetical protein NVP1077O_62 [Vibrio phage 1.077.O._10N.261.45.A10]|nr:hypothetical protein NVP1070O_62 [Vibrio phage 1.070.O._10N.261.45.B2]AUR85640.1 hypothetical protein NVP1077O_62 [Vibrio phage 1.077.O._10N.261.45.A10]